MGQEKTKGFNFMKDYSDDVTQNINVVKGWSKPNVLEMKMPKEYCSKIQSTKKGNILTLIE